MIRLTYERIANISNPKNILVIASKELPEKIFMIQLPKPERAIEALEIIKSGFAKNQNHE